MTTNHPLLEPVAIGGLTLPNRVAVAPMSRVSTAGDGVPTAQMVDYFAAFAAGGFGLILTDGTYIDHAASQAYPDQPAIVTDEQLRAWARVTDAVHAHGGRILLQLMHAGALVQGNRHGGEPIAPSAVRPRGRMLRGYGGGGEWAVPRAATPDDLSAIVAAFADSAARARTAGFDGVEVHGANGYLLDQFLTPYTNLRMDGYGGAPEARARLLAEVVAAIKDAAGGDFPVGVRVSQLKVNDTEHRWSLDEARAIFARIARERPAYVHVATEGAGWEATSYLAPGVSVASVAREAVGVPVIANGGMDDLELAARLLGDGHADLVSLGHAAIANPDWPARLAEGRPFEPFDRNMLQPAVTIENTERWRDARVLAA
jgi:2,4-dienoyl-CoA reductase-like NADH-dependent reductase (Old Yellow Enzyme family)